MTKDVLPGKRWYSEFLHRIGRFDAGFAEQKTALALNPNSARILNEMAWGAYLARRFDEAVGFAENARRIDKNNASALYNASEIYELKGDHTKAFELWKEAMISEEANRKWISNLEESFKKDGSRGFVRAKIEWLENLHEKDYIFPTDLAKGLPRSAKTKKRLNGSKKESKGVFPICFQSNTRLLSIH